MRAFFHPTLAVVADVLAITGIRPILRLLDVSVFDGIVMDVVEARPKIMFPANASVPVSVPNGSATRVVQRVQLICGASIESLHEFSKVKPMLWKKEKVIMVCENHPSRQFCVELDDQFVEYFNPQIEVRVGR